MRLFHITLLTLIITISNSFAHNTQHEETHFGEKIPNGITWEQWHMKQEHQLDDYDPEVFFRLHDLKSKGYLDSTDILEIYGLSRDEIVGKGDGLGSHDDSEIISKEIKSEIISKILKLIDGNSDDKITKEEFLKFAQKGGQFPDLNVGVGHHGDFEHEYEVHHWNKYHKDNDPDIKIVHKEDIEHELLHHEHEIEHEDLSSGSKFKNDDELELQINLQNVPNKFRV